MNIDQFENISTHIFSHHVEFFTLPLTHWNEHTKTRRKNGLLRKKLDFILKFHFGTISLEMKTIVLMENTQSIELVMLNENTIANGRMKMTQG